MKLSIEEIQAEDFASWDEAVASSPAGSPYATSSYLQVLSRTTGNAFRLVAVCKESTIIGGIGLFLHGASRHPVVRGRYLLYYNGPFIRELPGAGSYARENNDRRVLSLIESYLHSGRFSDVQIKGRHLISDVRPFLAKGWRVRPVYSYEVDISDSNACHDNMHRNVRRQLRQADAAGVSVSRSQDIGVYFKLHEDTCSRKGFPTYLKRDQMTSWFNDLQSAGLVRLYLAKTLDQIPVAGVLVLAGGHPVTHSVSAAGANDDVPTGTNAYLRWRVFEDLSSEGFVANDLTDAHNTAVANFKSQLGARLVLSHQLTLPATLATHLGEARRTATTEIKSAIKSLIGGRSSK